MIERKINILSVVMASQGRDIEMMIPVLYYCERTLGASIFFASGADARYWIDKLNPKLFIVPNAIGDNNYIKAVRYAAQRNVPVLSLASEGDLKEEKIHEMVWGLNKDKIMYEDFNLQWSNRAAKLIFKYYPELNNKIGVSGGVGFDRYKIYDFMKKEKFLNKYKKDYKKTICVAGWMFDQFIGDSFENDKDIYLEIYGEKQINNFKEDRKKVNKILEDLIENNEDILFILKYHPGTYRIKKNTEFVGLSKYNNVVEIQHEENIADCISASDLFVAYDSTSALEAWLLDKQTFLINPTVVDFFRSDTSKGSPIFKNYEECQKAINNFYKTEKIPGFEDASNIRGEIIKNIIGQDDGKNHIRAGITVEKLLSEARNRKIKKTNLLKYLKHYFIHIIFEKTRFITRSSFVAKIPIKRIRVLKYCQEIYNHQDIGKLKKDHYFYLDRFHGEKGERF